MNDFFKEMFIEIFEDGEYFLGILMWLLSLILLGLIAWIFGWLIDSTCLPIKEDNGIVTNKYVRPAHYVTTYIKSGEVLLPITTFYDDSYNITIKIDEMTDDVAIYQSSYNSIEIGEKLHCKYTNGRLFKTMYIQSIE